MYLLLIEYWFSVLSPPLVSMCRPICFFQCQYRLLEIKKTENWSLGPIFIHLLSWRLNFKQVSDYSVFLRCWLWGVRNQILLWPEQCVRGCCIRAKVAHFKNVYFIFIDQTTNWLIQKIMDGLIDYESNGQLRPYSSEMSRYFDLGQSFLFIVGIFMPNLLQHCITVGLLGSLISNNTHLIKWSLMCFKSKILICKATYSLLQKWK